MADHPPTPPVEIVASPSVDETMLEPPADSAIQEPAQLPPSDGRTEPIFSSANEASIPLPGEIDPQLPHPHAQAGDHVPASGNVEGDAMDVEPGTSVTPSAAAPGPNAHDDENKNEQQTAGPNLWAEQMRFQRQRDWIAAVGTQYPPPAPAPATAAPAAATPAINDTAMGDTAAAPGSVMQNEVVGSGTAETADSAVVSGYEDGDFGELEVDTDPDRDSALGDESESYTTSLNSEVTDYKFEHGRRYHAFRDEKYALPNDDEEINRLELQGRVWHLSLRGKLHLAPLPSQLSHVLDIGCGTGSWCIDFAEEHPECQVTGTDLSPIQPTMVPPNVDFLIDDIASEWLYPHKFDYIHSRMITVAVKDWGKLVDQTWKNLKPGGWVEFQEYHAPFDSDDGTLERGPSFAQWSRNICKAAAMAGSRLDAILGVEDVLKEKRFVGIGHGSTKWALGTWPKGRREKRIGEMFCRDILSALEASSMRLFTKVLGMETEEVLALNRGAEEDLRSGRMHAYMHVYFLWAQKPLDAVD